MDPGALAGLDRLIHEPARLGIMSVLASRPSAVFTELRDLLELTDGNLSVHLRTLEQAGYLSVEKSFAARKPRTTVRISRQGRAAFTRHVDALELLVRAARRSGS